LGVQAGKKIHRASHLTVDYWSAASGAVRDL
jgi:hypothetical protein